MTESWAGPGNDAMKAICHTECSCYCVFPQSEGKKLQDQVQGDRVTWCVGFLLTVWNKTTLLPAALLLISSKIVELVPLNSFPYYMGEIFSGNPLNSFPHYMGEI